MATTFAAGNATNGLEISSDNTGILALKSGAGAGATALTLDTSQNATFAGTVTAPSVSIASGALYPLVSGTAVVASGTSVDFTGIPTTAKRITVMFNGLSTNGSSDVQIQLGTSAGVEITGYAGTASGIAASAAVSSLLAGAGFSMSDNGAAASARVGSATLTLVSATSNAWAFSGAFSKTDTARTMVTTGAKSLAATLDRVRITTVNGTDTFDAGTINIMWE